MASVIDNNMSLYIPHIFSNYTKEDVSCVFEELKIGVVSRIDFVTKMNKHGVYHTAYIHFNKWYDNTSTRNLQERIKDPNRQARVMYDDPWYWIVLENTTDKFVPGDRKKRINIDFTPEKNKKNNTNDLINAPVKDKTNLLDHQLISNIVPINLEKIFDKEEGECNDYIDENKYIDDLIKEYEDNEEQEMDEIEAAIEEDEKYLVNIDSRYIKTIEYENKILRYQLSRIQQALINNTNNNSNNKNINENVGCMY